MAFIFFGFNYFYQILRTFDEKKLPFSLKKKNITHIFRDILFEIDLKKKKHFMPPEKSFIYITLLNQTTCSLAFVKLKEL